MSTRRIFVSILVAVTTSVACLATVRDAAAGAYPTNKCVSSKIKAAEKKCKALLKAWSAWDGDQIDGARDAALTAAATAFSTAWGDADTASSAAGVDCTDTTVTSVAMELTIDAAITDIVNSINAGLNLADPLQGACGAKLLKAAATKCDKFLKAESKFVGKLAKDPHAEKRDLARDTASTKFATAWGKVTGCPTTANVLDIEDKIDDLVDAVVTDTTISPNVDNTQFTTISPTGTVQYQKRDLTPMCSGANDAPTAYHFFVKRGTTNKLLMYYQGGGACFSKFTCSIPLCDAYVDPNGSDNPNNQQAGFGNVSNENNPFREWNIVFTSYCTCDIHFGDKEAFYGDGVNINHFGYQNARVVEKWAREHFVNPEEVFVTGSSAGAYGALFNAPLLEAVWPASKFSVLGDAGNGVITPDFLNTPGYGFQNWNFEANLPTNIPGVLESIQSGNGMPAYTAAVAAYFPDTAWGNYSTAYDGSSGGQTGFYNVMLNKDNPLEWLSWWHATCAWNSNMVQQAHDTYDAVTLANGKYRYYIGRGSRHTGWGSDTVVYNADPIAGTPALPALNGWVTSMLNRDAGWVNTECTNCETLLPGDPQPTTGTSPFFDDGMGGVAIDCTP